MHGTGGKSALPGSGFVRTVGPCAQTRVPPAIATARDALSNDPCESAACFKGLLSRRWC